jgi:hypothetical protein
MKAGVSPSESAGRAEAIGPPREEPWSLTADGATLFLCPW